MLCLEIFKKKLEKSSGFHESLKKIKTTVEPSFLLNKQTNSDKTSLHQPLTFYRTFFPPLINLIYQPYLVNVVTIRYISIHQILKICLMSYLYIVHKCIVIKVTHFIRLLGWRRELWIHVSVHFDTKSIHCKQPQVYTFKDHLWNVLDV